MKTRSELDVALSETQQAFADLFVMLSTIQGLRSRADQLLPLLLGEVRDLRLTLDHTITLLEEDQEGMR